MKRFVTSFRNGLRSLRSALHRRLDLSAVVSHADSHAPLAERVRWLETLAEWVGSASPISHEFDVTTGQLHWVRLRFLLHFLSRNPEWRKEVGLTIRSILEETSGVELFSRTGLAQTGGLLTEVVDRLIDKVLPSAPRERNLADLFPRIFRSYNDALWVENLPEDVLSGIAELIGAGGKDNLGLKQSLLDALIVLGEEIAARGLSPDVRTRLPFPSLGHSPFLKLRRNLEKAVESRSERAYLTACHTEIESCYGAIERIYHDLDRDGVSVALVHTLETQRAALQRTQTLLTLLGPANESEKWKSIASLLGALIRESLAAREIRPLLHDSLKLLSQKVVERAGASGEHYIAQTREAYQKMFGAGLGGGAITVLTTVAKFIVQGAKLPMFFEGLFASLNYGLSFSAIQLCGFSLATKQPAMTGPALAGKLRQLSGPRDIRAFVDEVQKLTRSQFAAAFGNVFAAIPCAIVFDMIYQAVTGHHVLTRLSALHTLHSFDPIRSLTLPFAAWTGVLLWSSGLVAGWAENWVVVRRLPDAISRHRILLRAFGSRRCERLSAWFLHNVGGITSSFFLGTGLAFSPIVGEFFGFPLEVRHVTLSSASLAFALPPLSSAKLFPWEDVALAALGIAFMLLLNLGVSLILAFFIACRAREVHSRSIFLLVGSTLREARKHPFAFLLPKRARVR